jgi:hypothetical protein
MLAKPDVAFEMFLNFVLFSDGESTYNGGVQLSKFASQITQFNNGLSKILEHLNPSNAILGVVG